MAIRKTWLLAALLLMIVAAAVPCEAGLIRTDDTEVTLYGASSKKNGLVKESSGLYRYYKNGEVLKNTWKTVDGKKYYFKSNGYTATESYKINGKYYIFNAKGQLLTPSETKVVKVNGYKYQVNKNGLAVSGWDGTGNYCFSKSGKAYTGIYIINKKYYCFKESGKYDKTTTTKLRSAASDKTANRKTICNIIIKYAGYEQSMTAIYKLLGQPKSTEYSNSCMGSGKDGILTYDDITVSTYKSKSGTEIFMAAWGNE